MTPEQIVKMLKFFHYSFATEQELQAGLEQVIQDLGWTYEREYKLDSHDRPDFFLPEWGICIEVKIGGASAGVLRQLYRYAEHAEVKGIVLVSSRARHQVPAQINDIPVAKLQLWGI